MPEKEPNARIIKVESDFEPSDFGGDMTNYPQDQYIGPTFGENHPMLAKFGRRAGKFLMWKIGMPAAALGLTAGAILFGVKSCHVDARDAIKGAVDGVAEAVDPGQENGALEISEAVVGNFNGVASSAIGSSDVHVRKIKQELIDKRKSPSEKPNPHETMWLVDGKYKVSWSVNGAMSAKKDHDGNLVVSLPPVETYDVSTVEEPKLEKSTRTGWQGFAGHLGASDTQVEDTEVYDNVRKILKYWADNPKKTAEQRMTIACIAVSSEAEKASYYLDMQGAGGYNLDRYSTPREEPRDIISPIKGAPSVKIQIPDPLGRRGYIAMDDCLETLDRAGYSTKHAKTDSGSQFNLKKEIWSAELKVPNFEQ